MLLLINNKNLNKMKKLFLLLVAIIIMVSCSPSFYGNKFTVIRAEKSKDPSKT